VSFALEMHLEQSTDDAVEVEAPLVIRGTPSLPRTGMDIRVVTAIAMVTALIGVAVYRWTAQRRRST
jgi:hypothetical protein